MLILQAAFHASSLSVWAESPADATHDPPRSPFDVDDDRLREALAVVLPKNLVPRTGKPVSAWLPTVAGQPVPSTPLVGPLPAGTAELKPWTVTTLWLPPSAVVEFLGHVVGRETLAPGVIVGSSLAYWAAALRFAGSLVGRDAYLPGLAEQNGAWRAVWRPVIAGPDAARFPRLAAAMPAAARALGPADVPPSRPATAVLTQFLTDVVDALVRSAPAARPSSADSVHDRWLAALTGPDALLTGAAAEWRDLAAQVAEWARPIAEAEAAAFRLCFRLEEPTGDDSWHVRYLLQAHDDPSLLIPAARAWKPRGAEAAAFRKRGFAPREYLLAALGQAARVSPAVDASLSQAAPAGYETDVTGAYDFLTGSAWLLEQAGFGVLLPAWWTGGRRRLAATASVKSPDRAPRAGLSLDVLVQFDWQLALGDEPVNARELEQLAALKAPLVRFRGQWVHVDAEQIRAALAALKKKGEATVRDLLRASLGAAAEENGLDLVGVRATGWIGKLLDELGSGRFAEIAPPAELVGQLRPYQVRGYSWLAFLRRWGLGACLADDMGLGKTVQTLALVRHAWADNRKPTLLVCPTSVIGNWQREAARFVPDLPVQIHHGPGRLTGAKFAKTAKAAGLVVTSYALLHRDAALLGNVAWSAAILDEAQNVKNPETKQARAARGLTADFRAALTGTPVENHVGDLWSIMEFLNPGLLGTRADFRKRYFLPIQARQDPAAAERLKQVTGPFVLRRVKTDKAVIADLPDKVEMKVFCRLTREQASLYAATVDDVTRQIQGSEGIQRKGMVLALLLRLKQICNHPAQFLADGSPVGDRSGKLNRLTTLLEEVRETREKVLVFSQFTEMGTLIRDQVQEAFGREALYLHGGVSRKARDELVRRFQDPAGPEVFVLSLKAGGTGLNLTAASHVVHFDRWWNPAVEDQATDRAFRIGQTRNVLVHKFVCTGTVEEKIDTMIDRKKAVAGRVVGTGEQWLTELGDRELKDVLKLSPDAVED